jgi:hypothetical protein
MYLDFFDRKILDVLNRRREPATLAMLVGDSGFARSTVIIHLERLGSEGLVLKEKKPSKVVEDPNSSITLQTLPIPRWLLSLVWLCWSFQGSKRPADTRRAVTANPQGTLVRA